jgi:hypothetical protein
LGPIPARASLNSVHRLGSLHATSPILMTVTGPVCASNGDVEISPWGGLCDLLILRLWICC